MRIAILGNSGSGKSTLARWIAGYTYAPLLDLDSVFWEPGKIAVPRSPEAATNDVRAFCVQSDHWVVEGCYASLIGTALEHAPLLIFLNPGVAQCISNCRARPWESHKYSSRAEQDQHLDFLLGWVGDYYTRDGDMSARGHMACFGAYSGRKVEVTSQPGLDPPSNEVLAWVT
jgi:adenylate kinase family enzyme